ncbi:MAG: hydrolase [Rhodospirillales bacterium]|jgi:N-acyl-phosphatidylethanolamine-hydrolysing phospholipase D|nr:hydrolase [Rhodospirillales bacterium]
MSVRSGFICRLGQIATVVLLATVTLIAACSTPGHKAGQPYHHTTSGFRNPEGSPQGFSAWERLPALAGHIFGRPEPVVPEGHVIPPDEALASLDALSGADSVTWIGHMTALLRLNGKVVLTDPFFSDYATPIPPFGPQRGVAPAIAIKNLPPINVVIISHSHYDHLDLDTIERLPNRDKITAVVPLGLGHYFSERGYGTVVELDWLEKTEVAGLSITAMPVIHWSKRSFFDKNDTLWAAYAIETPGGLRIYFGGDAEYGPVYETLRDSLGGFDAAILSVGAFQPRTIMQGNHCIPETCLKIGLDLDSHTLIAMHWGTIALGAEPFMEPKERFRAAGREAGLADDRVWTMKIGETRKLLPRPVPALARKAATP